MKYWFDSAFSSRARANGDTLLGETAIEDIEKWGERANEEAQQETSIINLLRKAKKNVKGYGGGWVARHCPEMLDEMRDRQIENETDDMIMEQHDCHHSKYGEDGCDCDKI